MTAYQKYFTCPRQAVDVDAAVPAGPLEAWRHGLGQGGVNPSPLPDHVVEAIGRLKPRLIRIFIQEFFDVYPRPGRFDWSRLDPYMDALARTGAKVMAAITIKPPALYPSIDQRIWRPADIAGWQKVVGEMVRRYSVEKPIVTHWEVGNETDIGEQGGCPYLIPDPADYVEYYLMTIRAILEAFPGAKVGGPACCWVENEPLPGLVAHCRQAGTPLDFVSWHIYNDDPARHAAGVAKARAMLADWPGEQPEMMVTEMNKGFDAVSVADLADEPRRAAAVGACVLSMIDAGLNGSFYYHIWDQTVRRDQFARFFAEPDQIMTRHWNEIPHRFGLFGVCGEVRPQYFLYRMLSRLGGERLAAHCDSPDLRVLAGRDGGRVSVLLVNYSLQASTDRIATVRFAGLGAGTKMLTTFRIDRQRRWDEQALDLLPLERREIDAPADYTCQVFCPADSVTLLTVEPL